MFVWNPIRFYCSTNRPYIHSNWSARNEIEIWNEERGVCDKNHSVLYFFIATHLGPKCFPNLCRLQHKQKSDMNGPNCFRMTWCCSSLVVQVIMVEVFLRISNHLITCLMMLSSSRYAVQTCDESTEMFEEIQIMSLKMAKWYSICISDVTHTYSLCIRITV